MRTNIFPVMILAVLLTLAVACGRGEAKREQVVFPLVVPEEGSDEAEIIGQFDKWVRAIRTEDWQAYLDVCNPNLNLLTVNQVEHVTKNIYSQFYDTPGLSARDVAVRVQTDGSASANFDFYGFEELAVPDLQFAWEKVSGSWHVNTNCTLAG